MWKRLVLMTAPVVGAAIAGGVSDVAASSAVGRCRTSDLTVTLGSPEGAAGTTYRPIVFRNHTGHTCSLAGYPGVSYVAGSAGIQVGPPASRVPGRHHTVVLAPGQAAHAILQEAETGNFSPGTCKPRRVRGLRVYPPNTRAAVFLPWNHRVCSRNVGQTGIRAVRRGTG